MFKKALMPAFDLFPEFDDDPSRTPGINSITQGHIWTPHFVNSLKVGAIDFYN